MTFEDIILQMDNHVGFTLPIPKELYKMANYVLKEGKLKADIFLTSGNIREKIDTNQPFDSASDDVYTVAFVLMEFL